MEFKPPGYSLHHLPRTRTTGGGVELLYRYELQDKHLLTDQVIRIFEIMEVGILVNSQFILIDLIAMFFHSLMIWYPSFYFKVYNLSGDAKNFF